MVNRAWKFDGEDVIGSEGAVITWEDDCFFQLQYNGENYTGEIIAEDSESNKLTVKINHRIIEVHKKGELDALIAALGLDKPKIKQLKELEAPIPGRIVNIAVEVGQSIEVGEAILSLEAMKMENVLKAEGIGVVKKILISPEDVVEKGAILMEFE